MKNPLLSVALVFCLIFLGCTKKNPPAGFVLIPAGSFWMGSPEDEPGRYDWETLHFVKLTKSFYMGKYQVTQGEFKAIMGYNPSHFKSCGDNCPVEQVSWHEAAKYANELSKKKGLPECFSCSGSAPDFNCSLKSEYAKPQECLGYRLPTESEWEYAIRAGTTTAFYSGEVTGTRANPLDPSLVDKIGWYGGNSSATTHPVGEKLPNKFGLYDMSGNIFESCYDWYEAYPAGSEDSPAIDPFGPKNGDRRILRGGSWRFGAQQSRSAFRVFNTPFFRCPNCGFRLARTSGK
ncbi:MAG: formylglycine-generating enzyme family protein [bacterium]